MSQSQTPKDLQGVRFNKPTVKKTHKLMNKIHALYLEGKSISAISRMEGMPAVNTIFLWKKNDPYFSKIMDYAKVQRAEMLEDKAIDAAESAVDKDDTPAARLRFDAYKWGAEVNDPSRYGKKVTHAGDSNSPIRFIVSTGFPEPNEHQKHPELGEDGLIKKSGAIAPHSEEEGPA